MAMRQRSVIMPQNSAQPINTAGGDAQDVNMAIILELMLDIRQITAANFVISNGGGLPTPGWLLDIAQGQ